MPHTRAYAVGDLITAYGDDRSLTGFVCDPNTEAPLAFGDDAADVLCIRTLDVEDDSPTFFSWTFNDDCLPLHGYVNHSRRVADTTQDLCPPGYVSVLDSAVNA